MLRNSGHPCNEERSDDIGKKSIADSSASSHMTH